MDRLTRLLVAAMSALTSSLGMAAPHLEQGGVTTVALHATVRLDADASVTLGAIAAIEGPQRDTLSALAIPSDPVRAGAWTALTAESVREAIEASEAHTGSVVVLGSRSSLTRRTATAQPVTAAKPTSPEPAPGVTTVRDHLESWLRSRFRAGTDDIRVGFDDRDRPTLTTPTAGRVVEVAEIGVSGRMALRVTVYEGDRIVLTEAVRARVELRRDAPVATRALRRGDKVQETDFTAQPVWLDPSDPPAPLQSLAGQTLRNAVEAGQTVRSGDIEPSVMIERGQDVSVRTVRGSVVVTTIARAKADAREGELVELEAKDRSGRRFTARVAGPGRAVMIEQEVAP